ncbi:hypothetical protein RFI_06181 [Reticulomyxa filosa]|uniref:Uncharacterized protein n=1 Tax=Reticulomyxa filosa TaxID=46433 RepID=X6NYM5_RETFI|nr:hypothetical protein RFI_06181 [Reticulomyxa filosa]|eukprot:ETO30939.1 hypothetical protein RFI_06181 [Reticulomyxa filosa]
MKLPICIRLNWMRIGSLDLWRNQKNLVQPWYTRNAERISTKNTSNSEKEKNNIDLYHWTTNPNIVEWLHGDDANVSNNEHYSNAKVYISSQERSDRVNSIIGRHPLYGGNGALAQDSPRPIPNNLALGAAALNTKAQARQEERKKKTVISQIVKTILTWQ